MNRANGNEVWERAVVDLEVFRVSGLVGKQGRWCSVRGCFGRKYSPDSVVKDIVAQCHSSLHRAPLDSKPSKCDNATTLNSSKLGRLLIELGKSESALLYCAMPMTFVDISMIE